MTSLPFVLSFKDDVAVSESSPTTIVVRSPAVPLNIPQYTLNLDSLSPGLMAAIKRLATDGATEDELSNLVVQAEGTAQLPRFYYCLQKFIDLGTICHTVFGEESALATRVPISPYKAFQVNVAKLDQRYVLSRFAYSRRKDEKMVLESPLSHAQIILNDWRGTALITELAKPHIVGELTQTIPGLSEKTVQLFLSLLLSSHMLSEVSEDGTVQEDENETLLQWEFHNLLFHSRSRTGRHNNPVGRTYPFLGKIEQLPAVKPHVFQETIDLYKPDIEALKQADHPFTWVLEERKSIRTFNDDEPITDQQLGEFLYRSARVREIIQTEREEISNRPYPSGSAAYELELYIAVNTCQGIPSGLYHYCPKEHQLGRICGRTSEVEALLDRAWLSNRQRFTPHLLIVIAARFPRVFWLHESFAYAGILKHVGIMYQTMYLVATAMKLAPCALGSGNSDLFATAAGTDYYAESSVGEFVLGSI